MAQWTTPDAYAGDVHDPMSQKPFMWNRNNPYTYSDPSGYIWDFIDPGLKTVIETLSNSRTFKTAYDAVADSPLKFSMKLVPASDVKKTVMPGRENDGISHTRLTLDGQGSYNGADISIGQTSDKSTLLNAVGGETFNAGSIATDLKGFLRDVLTSDATWGNVAEKKGAAGQKKIMSEIPK